MPPDSLRAVLDSVFAGPAYRWVERPEPLGQLRRWFLQLGQWLEALREHNPLGFRLVLGAVLVLLVAILVHAGWILIRTVRPAAPAPLPDAPARVRHDREWYRREAERLARAGRFAEAMQADFLGLVLALDGWEIVKFHPAKTPREYTREARLAPERRAELSALVSALYRYVFAREPCGPSEYAAWRDQASPDRYAPAH
jgi:hypothetical protein